MQSTGLSTLVYIHTLLVLLVACFGNQQLNWLLHQAFLMSWIARNPAGGLKTTPFKELMDLFAGVSGHLEQ